MASNDSDRPRQAPGRRPLIGLSSYLEQSRFGIWDAPAAVLHRHYLDMVLAAGGLPVVLPPVADWTASELSQLDGLVLSGGPDLDPARYGEPAHPSTGTLHPIRDAGEFALLTAALDAGLPVLGVCRGLQVLNVALGGTLEQHVPDRTGLTTHQPATGVFGDVEITAAEGSRLAGLLGHRVVGRCHHHQAVGRLADPLRAVAWADDGVVEAVELPGAAFVLGVQWHPEQDTADTRLFTALVDAAGDRQRSAA